MKLADLVKTPIFVLRKKDNQVNFLHLYQHVSTVLVAFGSVKYLGGGNFSSMIIINGIVHIVMYTYYLLSSRGRVAQKIAQHIKRYITLLHIVRIIQLMIDFTKKFTHLSYCYFKPYFTNDFYFSLFHDCFQLFIFG